MKNIYQASPWYDPRKVGEEAEHHDLIGQHFEKARSATLNALKQCMKCFSRERDIFGIWWVKGVIIFPRLGTRLEHRQAAPEDAAGLTSRWLNLQHVSMVSFDSLDSLGKRSLISAASIDISWTSLSRDIIRIRVAWNVVKSFLLAGYSCLNLTKLDVMTGIPGGKIKLAIDYKHEGKVWL